MNAVSLAFKIRRFFFFFGGRTSMDQSSPPAEKLNRFWGAMSGGPFLANPAKAASQLLFPLENSPVEGVRCLFKKPFKKAKVVTLHRVPLSAAHVLP